jgi:glycosyltransferase involved in cell wall biosynthesis
VQCGKCPQLRSTRTTDMSRWIWKRKDKHWKNLNCTIITPSAWMAECTGKSSLLQARSVHRIPYCIDLQTYRMIDNIKARSLLQLPVDKKLLLFGAVNAASDLRKGFIYLKPTLQHLSQNNHFANIELVIFGASESPDSPRLGFKSHYMGTLSDDVTLALLYSAADVFIAPSIQDNLPNTVIEASACGTPTVAFNIGGMPELIDHQKTGYLANGFSTEDLSRGITWVLENDDRYLILSRNARLKAEQEFSPEIIVNEHLHLYNDVLEQHKGF